MQVKLFVPHDLPLTTKFCPVVQLALLSLSSLSVILRQILQSLPHAACYTYMACQF